MAKSAKVIKVKNAQVIKGFDNYATVEWCTPSVVGVSACISAVATGRAITLTITLKTPFGNYSKSFSISNNLCFTFQPISKVKIEICISNFDPSSSQICFTLGGKVCLDVPFFGWKCTPDFSHQFCVPLPGNTLHDKLESGEFNAAQVSSLLHLNNLITVDGGTCNCH